MVNTAEVISQLEYVTRASQTLMQIPEGQTILQTYKEADMNYSAWDIESAQTFALFVDGFEKKVQEIEMSSVDDGIKFIDEPCPEPQEEEKDLGFAEFGQEDIVASTWKIN